MAQFAGEFPVATLDMALPYLRRPFTASAVKFKIQSAWTGQSAGALIVTYIDMRLVAERLNAVVGGAWHEEFLEPSLGETKHITCRLTVLGVTRQDVGEATGGIALQKALRSDALKRAGVKFGIGVSIYATPVLSLKPAEGLRPIKVWNPQTKRKDKDSFALNDKGQKTCRTLYAKWLNDVGVGAFGVPLDHGDIADSQGDVEVEQALVAQDEARQAAEEPGERFLTGEEIDRFEQRVKALGRDVDVVLGMVGVESVALLTNIKAFELWDLLDEQPKAAAKPPRRRRQS